jgi:hypothetical protein
MLGHDLPAVRAGRDLKGAHIAPAEIHPVIGHVGTAFEILTGEQTLTGPDGELRFIGRVPDRNHVFVDVGRVLDDFRVARRILGIDHHRLQRIADGIGDGDGHLAHVVHAEQLAHDAVVREQIGDGAVVGLARDVVEQ